MQRKMIRHSNYGIYYLTLPLKQRKSYSFHIYFATCFTFVEAVTHFAIPIFNL
jgi:hypothetical protein